MAAELYFVDGGIELAVPPLKALLTVMAKGEYEGMKLHDPEFRALFNREKILSSDWYQPGWRPSKSMISSFGRAILRP
jgi:hypothetical protein